MLKLILVAASLAGLHCVQEANRIGKFSHANFDRIKTGDGAKDVERLLRSAGQSLKPEHRPTDQQWNPVVKGDTFLKWNESTTQIIVGFENEKVVDKWYWAPSW